MGRHDDTDHSNAMTKDSPTRLPESCTRFEALSNAVVRRPLTDDELAQLFSHQTTCTSGVHAVARLEADLGLTPGAFQNGDPERGVPSAATSVAAIMARIHAEDVATRREIAAGAPPEQVCDSPRHRQSSSTTPLTEQGSLVDVLGDAIDVASNPHASERRAGRDGTLRLQSPQWTFKADLLIDLLAKLDPEPCQERTGCSILGYSARHRSLVPLGVANPHLFPVDFGAELAIFADRSRDDQYSSCIWRVARTKQTLRTSPLDPLSQYGAIEGDAASADDATGNQGMGSLLAVPVSVSERLVGVIGLLRPSTAPPFTPVHERQVERFGQLIAYDLAETEVRTGLLDALFETTSTISDTLTDQDCCARIAQEAAGLMRVDVQDTSIYLLDRRTPEYLVRIPPRPGETEGRLKTDEPDSLTAVCVRERQPVLVNDVPVDERDLDPAKSIRSLLAVPIPTGSVPGGIRGVIEATSHERDAFECSDAKALSALAQHTGHLLDRRDKQRLRRAIFDTVIDTSPSPIIAIDRKGRITEFNSAAQEVLGIDVHRPLTDAPSVVDTVWGGNEVLARDANLAMALATRRRQPLRNYYTTFYRRPRFADQVIPVPVRLAAAPLRDPNTSHLIGSIGIFEDLCAGRWCADVQRLDSPAGSALTTDPELGRVFEGIRQLASLKNRPLLLMGEAGSGKELLCNAIQFLSGRRGKLVTFNCTMERDPRRLERLLFGGEIDATRGSGSQEGIFELAQGGTVFLDEIAALPPSAQVRLERVIAKGTVERVDSSVHRIVPVQLVVASDRDLDDLVKAGRFRAELRRMLQCFELRIPPLRERRADILLLAEHFLVRISADAEGRPAGFASEVIAALLTCEWRGNVRELKDVVERSALNCLAEGGRHAQRRLIRGRHLPPSLSASSMLDVPLLIHPDSSNRIAEAAAAAAARSARTLLGQYMREIRELRHSPGVTFDFVRQVLMQDGVLRRRFLSDNEMESSSAGMEIRRRCEHEHIPTDDLESIVAKLKRELSRAA